MGYCRLVLRMVPFVVLVFGSLGLLLLVRLIERPLWGEHRPWTPYLVQFVCRNGLRILGIRLTVVGKVMREKGAIVANHSSWLDIFALNARKRVYFVAKSEVANWLGIGTLARATGTVFIERSPKQARQHRDLLHRRLALGHKLLFFPEGTSTDGKRVLRFKSTLFEALRSAEADDTWVQPVAVHYQAPIGADPRFYGWWGDMTFGRHLAQILATRNQGVVTVYYHPPLCVADYGDRKALAQACENIVADRLALLENVVS